MISPKLLYIAYFFKLYYNILITCTAIISLPFWQFTISIKKKFEKDQHLYAGDYKIILVKFQTTL